jgi:hypothetical protein
MGDAKVGSSLVCSGVQKTAHLTSESNSVTRVGLEVGSKTPFPTLPDY